MSEMAHTKAPWTRASTQGGWVVLGTSCESEKWKLTRVAEVHTHEDTFLIAAAPDLLAALENAEAWIPTLWLGEHDGHADGCAVENEEDCDCPVPTMRAAIAKARGEV